MASLRKGDSASGGEETFLSRLVQLVRQLLASERTWIIGLLAFEVLGCIAIILKVPYTEIDWIAYMQEVRGFLVDGETDYLNLRGDTGPLVYPGGFVWIFSALYYMTDEGKNLRRAQWLFAGLYLVTVGLVLALYVRTKKTPLPALLLLVLSKRVHSIFVLRMFNDCVAMAFLYAATLCFTLHQWWLGCALYSLGVSVKMNLFLFAPGLFLLLLQAHGLWRTVMYIAWCGVIQVVVGMPFLALHPVSYLSKAFELGRVFEFKWTVNWAFLPPEVFVSKGLSLLLLLLTAVTMGAFAYKWVAQGGAAARVKLASGLGPLNPDYVVTTLFVSNFIGIVFARTLHYQFYCWYFHTLPYLLWHSSGLPIVAKLAVVMAIEWAFNVFPATPASSAVLQCAHLVLLAALALSRLPPLTAKSTASKGTQEAGSEEVEVPEGRRITRSLAAAQKKVQ